MKKNFKYILGIQCFASMDSGACIIRVDYEKNDYDYVVINDNLEICFKKVEEIILFEKSKV